MNTLFICNLVSGPHQCEMSIVCRHSLSAVYRFGSGFSCLLQFRPDKSNVARQV